MTDNCNAICGMGCQGLFHSVKDVAGRARMGGKEAIVSQDGRLQAGKEVVVERSEEEVGVCESREAVAVNGARGMFG